MYLFLLALGAIITASGIALVASGVSIREHALDLATVTPGVVAAIGGLVLIGLGLAVRLLQRIEHALATRPAARANGLAEATVTTAQHLPKEPAQIAVAATAEKDTRPPAASIAAGTELAPEPVVDPTLEQFRETFSGAVRFGGSPAVPDNDMSLPSHPPKRIGEQPGGVSNGHASGAANGGAPVRMVPQRPEEKLRPVAAQPRRNASMFESLWPKGPRSGPQAQATAAQSPVPQTAEPEHPADAPLEPVPVSIPQPAPALVSVLKSGVVDGMAYTLYSDGSIEAQLPQGTLRFGSITELRNHIEQGS